MDIKLSYLSCLTLSLLITLFSCKKEEPTPTSNLLGSAEVVTNDVDDISIVYSSFSNVTDEKVYTYTCISANNEMSIGGSISSGSINVTITDQSGSSVYNQIFSSFMAAAPTFSAPAGNWTVRVTLTNASGNSAINITKV